MENEFDFFNQLSLSDLDRSRLGGYGTFDYTAPIANINTASNTNLNTGIQTVAPIDMIPAPIKPFINQNIGDNNDGGNLPVFTGNIYDEVALTGNQNNQNKIGILDALKNVDYKTAITNYLTNPATYLSMINPIAGIGYKIVKAKKEEQERIEKQAIEKARKEKEMQDIIKAAEKEAEDLANATRIGRRPTAPPQGGGGRDQGVSDSGGVGGGYSYDSGGRQGYGYGLKDGGRISYGKGGIVTL
jgi:hypothetical protein